MITHKRIHEGKKQYGCNICENHKIIHSGDQPFACDVCEKACDIEPKIILHFEAKLVF